MPGQRHLRNLWSKSLFTVFLYWMLNRSRQIKITVNALTRSFVGEKLIFCKKKTNQKIHNTKSIEILIRTLGWIKKGKMAKFNQTVNFRPLHQNMFPRRPDKFIKFCQDLVLPNRKYLPDSRPPISVCRLCCMFTYPVWSRANRR